MIVAIVLAAGLSQRMGRFKLTLPWGSRTVIGQVMASLEASGLTEIVAVTGHRRDAVASALAGTAARIAHNPNYAAGEMLSSVQAGLAALAPTDAGDLSGLPLAALLCLGDQPQMRPETVRGVLAAGAEDAWTRIVVPSYGMRAGHPILLPRWVWPEILACTSTLRDVLAGHREQIRYLVVDTPSVLADLDTPEDYQKRGEPSCA